MYNNIIFIGGVHGVGKGTICQKIKEKLDFTHLSASEVLKWDDFKNEKGDKRVENVSTTQQRLIENLKNIVNPQKKYLLVWGIERSVFSVIGENSRNALKIKWFSCA